MLIRSMPQPLDWAKIVCSVVLLAVFFLVSLATAQAGQVTLAWNASSGPVAGYNVYYRQQSGSYPATPQQSTASTTATVANLTDGATYYFVVKAHDGNGTVSAPSNEVSAVIGTPTDPPSDEPSPQNGLVAAYNFDEGSGTTTHDISGNNHTGTLSGATWTTAGKYAGALDFNGSTGYMETPHSSLINIISNQITLEAWVNPDVLGTNMLIVKPVSTSSHISPYFSYSLHLYPSGKPRFYLTLNGNAYIASSSVIPPVGQWTHLAGVYDGTSMKIYVNGQETGSTTASGNITGYSTPLRLGTNGGFGEDFDGKLDDVRIYNRALSASEILTNMNTPVGSDSTKVQYTFTTQPSGLSLSYGGVSRVTPFTVDAVVGSKPTISAPTPQQGYNFSAWSDGGTATHTITIGSAPQTLTATYVAAISAPTAEFSADKPSGPASLAVQFTDKSTNATAWSWNFGDGATSTQQSPSHVYTAVGTYTVTLTASNSAGSDVETKTGFIQVAAAPVASFTVSPTSDGNTASIFTFTNTSTGTVDKWSWNFGDNTSSTDKSPVHTYSKPGTYTVSLTATGPGGSHTATQQISVTEAPPLADFSASPTSGSTATQFPFADNSKGTITTWSWNFGDGTTSTTQNPAKTYSKAGTYTVSLTTTGPGGSDTETKTDYINVVTTTGLVAAYGFEEASGTTVTDVSGNGNHGTLSGAARTTGKFGKALSFDGVNDWVSIPDADSLDLTTAMTLSAWVYPNRLNDRQPILAKQGTTKVSPYRGYMLSAGDKNGGSKIEVEVFKSDNATTDKSFLYSRTALNTTGWQHVAFVYQYVGNGTSKMTLYINGVASGSSTTAVGPVQKNAQPLDLGRYYWDSSYARYFNGLIDEVRIYNRALSTTEIAADMNKAVAF